MRKPLIPALVLLAAAGLAALTGCAPSAGFTIDADRESASGQPRTSQAPTAEASSAAPQPAVEQTAQEACAIAQETMTSLQTEMTGVIANIGAGDTAAATATLETFDTRLSDAVDRIAVPDVDSALSDFRAKFAVFTDLIASAQGGGIETLDQSALQAATTEIQTSAQSVQTLCS